jgi:hypothetical protein
VQHVLLQYSMRLQRKRRQQNKEKSTTKVCTFFDWSTELVGAIIDLIFENIILFNLSHLKKGESKSLEPKFRMLKVSMLFVIMLIFLLVSSENLPKGAFRTTQYRGRECSGPPMRNITYYAENCWKAENQKYQRRYCDNKTGFIYWSQYNSNEGCIGEPQVIFRNKNGDCTEFYNEKYHSCEKLN